MTAVLLAGTMMPNLQHSVMCFRRNLVPGAPETRGHWRSLFRCALAKVILAHLPAPTSSSSSMPPAGPRLPPPAFRQILLAIRKDGFHMTCGEDYSGIFAASRRHRNLSTDHGRDTEDAYPPRGEV